MKPFLPTIPTASSLRLVATHSLAIAMLLGMTTLAMADSPQKGGSSFRSIGSKASSSSYKQSSVSTKMPSVRSNPVSGLSSKPISQGFKHPPTGTLTSRPNKPFTPGPKLTPISSSPIVKPGLGGKPGTVPKIPVKPFPPLVGGGGLGTGGAKPPLGPIGPISPKPPVKPPLGPIVGPIGPIGPKPPIGPVKPPVGPIGPIKPPKPFPPKPFPPKPQPPQPPHDDHDHDHHHHHPPLWPIGLWPVPRGPIYCPTPAINTACPVVIGSTGIVTQPSVILDGPVTSQTVPTIPQVENGSEFTMLVEGDASQIRLAVLMVNTTQMKLEITSAGQGYVSMKMPQLLLGNTQPAAITLMANETTPLAQVNIEIILQQPVAVSLTR